MAPLRPVVAVLVIGQLLLAVQAVDPPAPAPVPTYEARLHFVNDLRYNLYPLAADGAPCATGTCYGGLACLSGLDHTGAVWLNAGVSMGYGAIDAKGDVYRALKAQKAAAALSQLKFSAMSVDADMFRYGKDVAKEHLQQLSAATCANCNVSAIQDLVKPYQLFDVTAPSTCSIGVIGIISKSRAKAFLASEAVREEVQSIKEAITQAQAEAAKNNKKVVFVVIGEANESMADSILKDTDASVVLHSGSLVSALTYTYTTSGLRATLPPANSSATMAVAQVSLQLKEDCTLSAQPTIALQAYNTDSSKCTAPEAVTKAMTDIQQAVTGMTAKVGRSLLPLAGGLETCGSLSCAVGQLVADGVRAVGYSSPEAMWNTSVRAVIIPANALPAKVKDSELPAGDLTLAAVLNALQDDANMCRVLLTGKKLARLLEAMLSKGCVNSETFPQLSGLRVVVDAGAEVGSRVLLASLQQADLSMWAVPLSGSDVSFYISMPCFFFERDLPMLDSSLLAELDITATDVWLSEGLLWHVQSKTLIPPLVEERFHLNIPFPSRFDLCEDMTAVTVCYTFLVLGALAMIGYQGYQFWRFRTTLSYIR